MTAKVVTIKGLSSKGSGHSDSRDSRKQNLLFSCTHNPLGSTYTQPSSHHIFFLFWLSLLSLAWKGLSRKALIVTAKVVTRMTKVVTRLEDVGLHGFDSDSFNETLDGHRFDNKKPTL